MNISSLDRNETPSTKSPGLVLWTATPKETLVHSPMIATGCSPASGKGVASAGKSGSGKKSSSKKRSRPWSTEEDEMLTDLVISGPFTKPNWPFIARSLTERTNRTRTNKQCRERWLNVLDPDIKKGDWTLGEEEKLLALVATHKKKWSSIALQFENRAANDIKNKYYSMVRSTHNHMAKRAARAERDRVRQVPIERHLDNSHPFEPAGLGQLRQLPIDPLVDVFHEVGARSPPISALSDGGSIWNLQSSSANTTSNRASSIFRTPVQGTNNVATKAAVQPEHGDPTPTRSLQDAADALSFFVGV